MNGSFTTAGPRSRRYCKGVAPGGGRIIACLAQESDKITPACKKVLTAAERK